MVPKAARGLFYIVAIYYVQIRLKFLFDWKQTAQPSGGAQVCSIQIMAYSTMEHQTPHDNWFYYN